MIEEKLKSMPFDDMYEKLKNENKVFKSTNKKFISSLSKEYQYFLSKLEGTTDNYKEIDEGKIVSGNIVGINDKDIIIDINFKDNVFVEKRTIKQAMLDDMKIGNPIDVMISEIRDNPYYIKGSITDILKMNISNIVKDGFNEDVFFYATVLESQPAGYKLELDVEGQLVDAFMPNTLAGVNKLHDPESIVGQRFEVMIETLEQDKGVYVVNRKKYLESLIPNKIKQLRKEWGKDKTRVYEGHITGTTPFGAFVEFLTCLTGMIYRQNVNIEWQNDEKWATLKPGMNVNFYVKDIIPRKNKIILTQILRESLWDKIRIDEGGKPYFHGVDNIIGKVAVIKPFGALVQLDDETSGLIPSTYLLKNKINLKVGQKVEVTVNSIIRDERKINLSYIRTI